MNKILELIRKEHPELISNKTLDEMLEEQKKKCHVQTIDQLIELLRIAYGFQSKND